MVFLSEKLVFMPSLLQQLTDATTIKNVLKASSIKLAPEPKLARLPGKNMH